MSAQYATIGRILRLTHNTSRSRSQPEDYISFFSLRGWGKFKNGVLTTEQVYIHAKVCLLSSSSSSDFTPDTTLLPPSVHGRRRPSRDHWFRQQ